MQNLPHTYTVTAAAGPSGPVPLSSDGLPILQSAPPPQFGGPGNVWSPETLLCAAVADCLVLTFRAITRASGFEWLDLNCRTQAVLDRADGATRFTRFDTHAVLVVPAGADVEKARRLLERSERTCLVSSSLTGEKHLTVEVRYAG
ncbi:MAG: OsmC family protein [Gammaproteobacteria bacterium]